jgi:hypothetical protein
MLLVLVVDLGIVHLARSQVQMTVDAGSLAAVTVENEEIALAGVQFSNDLVLDFTVEINEEKAKTRAREVVLENLHRIENITWEESDFIYRKVSSTSYYVEVTFEVQSVLLGTLSSAVGYDKVLLTVGSEGEVNLTP